MSRNGTNGRNNNNEGSSWGPWTIAGAVVGGLAAAAGGVYLLTRNSEAGQPSSTTSNTEDAQERTARQSSGQAERRTSDCLSRLMEDMYTNGSINFESNCTRRGVPRSSIPDDPIINNLNALLSDIYLRYIALNDEDFEMYYSVVHVIFSQIHNKMKEVDSYYRRYSSTVQFAGSHPDRLRINKPDEFDIDIVIGLPLSIKLNPVKRTDSDFIIEPKDPGFVQLKMGVQYQRLYMRDSCDWHINKAAYEWKDDCNYLLRSEFMNWFKSVFDRALNQFKVNDITSRYMFYVEGVPYTVRKSESGPALTMYVENCSRNFKLDVDLVPALKFPIDRWPICRGYTDMRPEWAVKDYWMVVPKPNKNTTCEHDRNRSWRVAMHEQERMLMHDTNNMRHAIRLLKKLRDSQNMTAIASYYIKTLFFWEFVERNCDRTFWNNNPAFLFKIMLKKFYNALVDGNIPYFWNKSNNLIGKVDRMTLTIYARKVGNLLKVLEEPSEYKQVAKFLLTPSEFREYNEKFLHI